MNVPTGEFRALVDDVAAIKHHLGARDELVASMADKLVAALRGDGSGDAGDGAPRNPARHHARTSGRPRGHLRSIAGGQQ